MRGSLPEAVQFWTALTRIDLQHNSLSGSIPKLLPSWTGIVQLQHNMLRGRIPPALGFMAILGQAR